MPIPEETERHTTVALEKRVLLLSLIVLIVGCTGYFGISRGSLMFYFFAHFGALGLLGLIGGGIGILARKKGRGYVTALLLGSVLPIISGLVAVAMISGEKPCGGSVSLAVAILVAVAYLFTKKRTVPQP